MVHSVPNSFLIGTMTSTRSERLFDDGCYLGFFDSVADYAQEITEVPDHLQHYVDSESMA